MIAFFCLHSIIVDNNLICVLFSGEKETTQDKKSEANITNMRSYFQFFYATEWQAYNGCEQ